VLSQGDILRTSAAFAQHLVKTPSQPSTSMPKDDVEPTTDTAAADPKPSEGLTVTELKAALDAKGIPIPEGAKKPDLVTLLDGQKGAE
jgi:hypothetical protein